MRKGSLHRGQLFTIVKAVEDAQGKGIDQRERQIHGKTVRFAAWGGEVFLGGGMVAPCVSIVVVYFF